jgi:CHAT domain-containing protein
LTPTSGVALVAYAGSLVSKTPPAFLAEVEAISAHDIWASSETRDITLQRGDRARRLSTLNTAAVSRLLVLGGHAEVDDLFPHRSGINLADGRLTAHDLVHENLSGAIVILSGCWTGVLRRPPWQLSAWITSTSVGHGTPAQSLEGLVRSCLLAGARAVVATLTRVDDLASALLVEFLHRRLAGTAGLAVSQALSQAQQDLQTMGTSEIRHRLEHWERLVREAKTESEADADEADAERLGLILDVVGEWATTINALPPDATPFAHLGAWASWVCFGDPEASLSSQ